jgi:FAD/FMN-containing dehydrogenase
MQTCRQGLKPASKHRVHMKLFRIAVKFGLALSLLLAALGWQFIDRFNPGSAIASIAQNPLIVNDVTGLNPVPVSLIIKPHSELDITDAIMATSGPISIGGARYSMGGQIAYPDSLHLDMREYNKITRLDTDNKLITVQPGITWREVQKAIDPHDLSVRIMQDFNNFTVGGSLSVNAHGRYANQGPIINSVRSMRIALADGKVYEASPTQNNALFYGAIGGYGGLGVITEVTLELTENVHMERFTDSMSFVNFLDFFKQNIRDNTDVVMHNALLYPPSFENILNISWRKTDKPLTNIQRLQVFDASDQIKPILVEMLSRSNFLKRLRRSLYDLPMYNQPAVVTRNWESSADLRQYGFSSKPDSTLALREYFVPVENFEIFVLKMRDVFIRHDVNVLNISIRYSPKDPGSLLAWAHDDMFSFVVVYRQDKDQESLHKVAAWSQELIKSAQDSNGSYYLPFQKQASSEQFFGVYRDAPLYFDIKKKADPDNRFNNLLLDKHNPYKLKADNIPTPNSNEQS